MIANNNIFRLLAIVAASALVASPVLAEKPEWAGKGGGKHAEKQMEKAEKHADKQHERGMKMAEKQREAVEKHNEKAAKHAAKQRREDVRIGGYFNDDHRHQVRTYYTTQYSGKACPPGLAKKNNGCLPPGHAKKLAVGQPLPSGVTQYPVPPQIITQLPLVPPGYRYVRVGNDIVLLPPQRSVIVDIISGLLG